MFFVFAIIFAPSAENRLVAFSSRIDTRKLSDPFPPKAPTYDVEVCDEPTEYRTLFHTSRCWTTSSDSLLLIDWLILTTSTGRKFVGVLYIAASRWIHSGANGCQSSLTAAEPGFYEQYASQIRCERYPSTVSRHWLIASPHLRCKPDPHMRYLLSPLCGQSD